MQCGIANGLTALEFPLAGVEVEGLEATQARQTCS